MAETPRIYTYIDTIRNAVFGKDVRTAIADGIQLCYDEAGEVGVEFIRDDITRKIDSYSVDANGIFHFYSKTTVDDVTTTKEIPINLGSKAARAVTDALQTIISNKIIDYDVTDDGILHFYKESCTQKDEQGNWIIEEVGSGIAGLITQSFQTDVDRKINGFAVDQNAGTITFSANDMTDLKNPVVSGLVTPTLTSEINGKVNSYNIDNNNVLHLYANGTEVQSGIQLTPTSLVSEVAGKVDYYEVDANNKLHLYTTQLDANGRQVLDENENPVKVEILNGIQLTPSTLVSEVAGKVDHYEIDEDNKLHLYTTQLDANGQRVLDEDNNPVEVEIGDGIQLTPASLTSAVDKKIDYYTVVDGTLYFYSTRYDENGDPVLDEQGNPVRDQVGTGATGIANGNYLTQSDVQTELRPYINKIDKLVGDEVADLNDPTIKADGIQISYGRGGTPDIIHFDAGGKDFDAWNIDGNNKLHLTLNGIDVINPITLPAGGGSGSGTTVGSNMTFTIHSGSYMNIVDSTKEAIVEYTFTSMDPSNPQTQLDTDGTLVVTVNNVNRATIPIQQTQPGSHGTVNIFQYLNPGTNNVVLTLTDTYQSTASRRITMIIETFNLTWDLDSVFVNVSSDLTIHYKPYGNGLKHVSLYIDGNETPYFTDDVTTSGVDRPITITGNSLLPNGQRVLSHGFHYLELKGVLEKNGKFYPSNILHAGVAQNGGESTPIIAVDWPTDDEGNFRLTQYNTVSIPYVVYDPMHLPTTITLTNDSGSREQEVERKSYPWTFRVTASDHVLLSITCGNVTNSQMYNINANESAITEVMNGLICKVDPNTISDLTSWRNDIEGYTNYKFTLSPGFDTVNGGVTTEKNGTQYIRVMAGDRLTLTYDPFYTDPIDATGTRLDPTASGIEFKVIYKIAKVSDKRTVGISCVQQQEVEETKLIDGEEVPETVMKNVGFELCANNAYLYGTQTTVTMSLCEDEKTELDISIEKKKTGAGAVNNRLLKMMEKCSTFSIAQYGEEESFLHKANTGIVFGSDDAEVHIYLVRGYNRELDNFEMLTNFEMDGENADEISARIARNDVFDTSSGSAVLDFDKAYRANPDCHFIQINAPQMSIAKEDDGGQVIIDSLVHKYYTGGAEHNFTVTTDKQRQTIVACMDVQGTSSVEHATTAGGNLNLRIERRDNSDEPVSFRNEANKIMHAYAMHGEEESIPTTLWNYKKNVASQEHVVNRTVAKWYNDYQPNIRPARVADPRIRDCLECVMTAVFFTNTNSSPIDVGPDKQIPTNKTIFFGLGNLCSSKDDEALFDYDDIVIEVADNFQDQVRFKSDNFDVDIPDPKTGKLKNAFDYCYKFRYLNTKASFVCPGYPEAGISSITEEEFGSLTKDQKKARAKLIAQTMFKNEVQSFIYKTDCEGATNANLGHREKIGNVEYEYDTVEYRKAKWNDPENGASAHFVMDTLYWHYVMTLFFLLRDNHAKNMFWSRNSEGKWGLWFNWDNDTGLCRNNEGYIDMEPGYMDDDYFENANGEQGESVFNAVDSALFANLRENNHEQLRETYVAAERKGAWNLDTVYGYIKKSQNQIAEALWMADAEHNAIKVLQNLNDDHYLARATGKLDLHLLKALKFQKALIDSYFLASDSTTDRAKLRVTTPVAYAAGYTPNPVITVTAYTNLYVTLVSGPITIQERVDADTPTSFTLTGNMNDTETYLYSSEWISGFADLALVYMSQFEIPNMRRVRNIQLGTYGTDGKYYNVNSMTLNFSNCERLESVNLAGLRGVTGGLSFSNSPYLKTIDTRGSGLTGLTFANNGRLVSAKLNAVSSLSMRNLRYLTTFSMESYRSLLQLTIENISQNVINTLEMVQKSVTPSLYIIRLLGIDWTLVNASIIERIYKMSGLNDSGIATSHSVLGGIARIRNITEADYNKYLSYFENRLQIIVNNDTGEYLPSYSVQFRNWDGTLLNEQSLGEGAQPEDPTEFETDPIAPPERPNTSEYKYEFDGWALSNDATSKLDFSVQYIQGPTTYYAFYKKTKRTYTVKWMNELNPIGEPVEVNYGGSATYTGEIPKYPQDGSGGHYFLFTGWDKSTAYIDGTGTNENDELIVNAQYSSAQVPNSANDNRFTPEQLNALIKTGILDSTTNRNTIVKSGTDFNILLGNDYNYDNVTSYELVSLNNPKIFEGTDEDVFIPLINGQPIKLFDEDKNWTLVVDYYLNQTQNNNSTIFSCYSDGIGLNVTYGGTSSSQRLTDAYCSYNGLYSPSIGEVRCRQIVVIRHKKGTESLKLFYSDFSFVGSDGGTVADTVLTHTLTSPSTLNVFRSTQAPLSFGGSVSETGTITSKCFGKIYWAKLWNGYLGDDECANLAAWPRETITMTTVGSSEYQYRTFQSAEDSTKRANCCFLSKQLMRPGLSINLGSGNSGGWPSTSARRWLNARFILAFPIQWRQIFLKVIVKSSAGDGSLDIVSSQDYIWYPSVKDLNVTNYLSTDPYAKESDSPFNIFSQNNTRIKTVLLDTSYDPDGNVQYYRDSNSNRYYYTRSPYRSTSSSTGDNWFGIYWYSGGISTWYGSYGYPFCFGFCI